MVIGTSDFLLCTSHVQLEISQLTIGIFNFPLVGMVLFRFYIRGAGFLKCFFKALLKSKFEIVELESLLHIRIVLCSPCKPLLCIVNPDCSVGLIIRYFLNTDSFSLSGKCGCSCLLFCKYAICFVLFILNSLFNCFHIS
jgi:hypothetical protein